MKKTLLLFFAFLISCNNIGKLKISHTWFRPVLKGMNTALYFTVENNTNQTDTLYSVKSSISDMVQIHETFVKDGMKGMRPIKFIVVKPHSKVEFKPGGFHVMVMNVKGDYKKSSSAKFDLYFKRNGKVKITANVKE